MSDELIQVYAAGVLGALVAFEVVAALVSWVTARGGRRPTGKQELWFTRPFAIRDHFRSSRDQMTLVRAQYQVLRMGGHALVVRRAIRQLPRIPDRAFGCASCTDSRVHGRARCLACDRRLAATMRVARA